MAPEHVCSFNSCISHGTLACVCLQYVEEKEIVYCIFKLMAEEVAENGTKGAGKKRI